MGIITRFVVVIPVALASLASSTVVLPGPSGAVVCGPGTFYDAPSDSCLVAAPPPPPPAYPYGGYGYGGDLTPGFSVCLGAGRFFHIHACI
jgi:hypothetical protein